VGRQAHRRSRHPGTKALEELLSLDGSGLPTALARHRRAKGDFDADFGVDEWHGTNAFFRDGDRVFRTYFVNNRGDEAMGSTWSYLDITALGRQEDWENSPEATPQTPPYEWWNWHDEYGDARPSQEWSAKIDTYLNRDSDDLDPAGARPPRGS
jgi:predicted dithiol-disulfide oxidoreductase (DUF899 family)